MAAARFVEAGAQIGRQTRLGGIAVVGRQVNADQTGDGSQRVGDGPAKRGDDLGQVAEESCRPSLGRVT